MVDSTIVRARRVLVGAKNKGLASSPSHHDIGRSHGDLATR